MSFNTKYSFCLLQYLHDPWLKERMNIGVVLLSEESDFLGIRHRGWQGRIFKSYPDLNRPAYTEDLKQIERGFKRFERENLKTSDLFYEDTFVSKNAQNRAISLSKRLYPDLDSSYVWVTGGSGVCSDPLVKIDELFERFVTPYDKEHEHSFRDDAAVWNSVTELLKDRNVSHQIVPKTINTDLGSIGFSGSYLNGAVHLIQSLSFDLASEESVVNKAAKWGGFIQAVNETPTGRNFQPHLVLGKPSQPKLEIQFEKARKFLVNFAGKDGVVLEENAASFADTVADQLASH